MSAIIKQYGHRTQYRYEQFNCQLGRHVLLAGHSGRTPPSFSKIATWDWANKASILSMRTSRFTAISTSSPNRLKYPSSLQLRDYKGSAAALRASSTKPYSIRTAPKFYRPWSAWTQPKRTSGNKSWMILGRSFPAATARIWSNSTAAITSKGKSIRLLSLWISGPWGLLLAWWAMGPWGYRSRCWPVLPFR